jgi:hypothetical protein
MAGKISSPMLVDDLNTRKIQIPHDKELITIYEELTRTNPEYFTTEGVEPDPDWLKDFGLSPLYYYRWKKPTDLSLKGCEGAYKMLEDPRMMKFMHLLTFSGIPKDDIELILNAKYNISYETDDFKTVFQYFTNYDGWTYPDKEIYSDQILDLDLRRQYKMALTQDRGQLLWEIGLGVDPDMSVGDLLQDMLNDSYRFFKRLQKNRPEEARDYASLAVKISDRIVGMKDKESDSHDLISQLKITLTNQESKPDPKQSIVNFTELNIDLPAPTREVIPNLSAIMEQDNSESPKDISNDN